MSAERFLDTNVLVYFFDRDEPETARRSREILAGAGNVVSTQVLQEFYVVSTRKLAPALAPSDALAALRNMTVLCSVLPVDTPLVLAAARRSAEARLPFRDALVVEAAVRGGCQVLFSEDMRHGRVFDGRLTVHNPYVDLGPAGAGMVHDAPRSRPAPRAAASRRR